MRFTGGALGVLAGFMYYYGDQILNQFQESMQQIRFQYTMSDSSVTNELKMQKTCREILS